jgi:hypothetical protein
MKHLKLFEEYKNNKQEIIAYHSTNDIITNFNFKDVDSKAGSSTRMNVEAGSVDDRFISMKPKKHLVCETLKKTG